jgi:hypothetical protein
MIYEMKKRELKKYVDHFCSSADEGKGRVWHILMKKLLLIKFL